MYTLSAFENVKLYILFQNRKYGIWAETSISRLKKTVKKLESSHHAVSNVFFDLPWNIKPKESIEF